MRSWLETRLDGAPQSLRDRVLRAIPEAGFERRPSAEALRELARGLVEEAKAGAADYETALTLLAADAVITYSCEFVAEQNPEQLAEM